MQRIAPLVPFRHRQRQRRVKNRSQRINEWHVRLDARVTFRSHIRNRAHEQAARRAAFRNRTRRRGEPHALQGARCIDEILEGVLLVESPPLLIPGAAHFPAATDVHARVQHAAIEQTEPGNRESGVGTDFIRPVPEDEHRR